MALKLEIITPKGALFEGEVEMVTIPGEEGVFGVMENHTPIVAQLKAGEVEVYQSSASEKSKTFKVEGGFAETDGKKCIVLSDKVESEEAA